MRSLRLLAADLRSLSELSDQVAEELEEIAEQAANAKPAEIFAIMSHLLAETGGDAVEPSPFDEPDGPDEYTGIDRQRSASPQNEPPSVRRALSTLKSGDTIYRVRRVRFLKPEEKEEIRQWWKGLDPSQIAEDKLLAMKRSQAKKYGVTTKVISGVIGAIFSQRSSQNGLTQTQ